MREFTVSGMTEQQKGPRLTILYSVTEFAKIIGWLAGSIQSANLQAKQETDMKIYDISMKIFASSSMSCA
jgi:hypothetical protein